MFQTQGLIFRKTVVTSTGTVWGAHGGIVVKELSYKAAGRGFDSQYITWDIWFLRKTSPLNGTRHQMNNPWALHGYSRCSMTVHSKSINLCPKWTAANINQLRNQWIKKKLFRSMFVPVSFAKLYPRRMIIWKQMCIPSKSSGMKATVCNEVLWGLVVGIVTIPAWYHTCFCIPLISQLQLGHLYWPLSPQSVDGLHLEVPQLLHSYTSSLTKALLKLSKHISVWMRSPWITCSIFLCSSTSSICHVCILGQFRNNWAPLCTMCTQYTNNAIYDREKFVIVIDNDVLSRHCYCR